MNMFLTWLADVAESSAPGMLLLAKLTVLLSLAWLLHAALAERNPRWRVLLWRSTAVGALLLAGLSLCPTYVKVPVLAAISEKVATVAALPEATSLEMIPAASNPAEMNDVAPASRHPQGRSLAAPEAERNSTAKALNSSRLTHATAPNESARLTSATAIGSPLRPLVGSILFGVWCGGTLLGTVWSIIGLRRLAGIRKRSAAVPSWVEAEAARVAAGFNLRTAFELRQTTELLSPCVVGLRRRVIFLPARQCERAYQDELSSILAHELAHLKGGDLLWNAVLQALTNLLWFHPLAWCVRTTHADACDAVSDAIAAGYVGDAAVYSRILARLTLRITARSESVGLAMARTSCMTRRIAAVRGHIRCSALPGRSIAGAVVVATAAIFALGGLAFTPTMAEQRQARSQDQLLGPSQEPGVVTGTLVLADGGAPVAGAKVLLRDRTKFIATSDDQGRFRFENIPAGQYAIWAHQDNIVSPKERLVGREAVNSAGGVFPSIRLTMKLGQQIRLEVRSAVTGQPVEGADVRLGYPDRRQTTTSNEGTAVLPGLLPEKYFLTIQAAGHARAEEEIDLSGAGPVARRSFSLVEGGVVRGTVVDASGLPLEGVDISYFAVGTPVGFGGESPQTDAKGQFRHLHLPLQTSVKVLVKKQDYLPLEKSFTLTGQQREQDFKFQLERRPRGGSIAGTVTDPDGKPIAGAIVRNVGNDPNQNREAKTDAKGRFVLNDLLEGLAGHEITVRARKFATLIQTVEPGREESPTPVSIHLEAGHSIRGRVLNRAGEPVKGAYVAANGFGDWGIGETVRTNDAGEFEFDSLPDGSKFTIQANGYPVSHDLALTLDQKQMVDVRLESMAVLRGRVVDAETRKPLQGFRIRGGFSKDRRQTDAKGSYPIALEGRGITFQPADGVFAVNDLTKGVPLEIGVEADGYDRQVFRRVVPESDEADQIELVLLKKRDVAKLAGLVGTIIDRRGKPAADVQLRLIVTSEPATGEDDRQFNWALINSGQLGQRIYVDQYLSAVTGADGKFEFNELLPEKFLQIAFWGDAVPKSRTLDLDATEPGVRQSTTIQFSEPARIKASFDAAVFPDAGEIQLNYDDDSLLSYKLKLADKQTKFEFGNLPPGRCSLSITAVPARHPDNPDLFTVRSLAKCRLTIEPGETYELEFTADDAAKPGQ